MEIHLICSTVAREVTAVAGSSKFHRRSLSVIADVSDVHRIITDYSGTIQVSSHVGSGTTMRVRLPGQHEVAEGRAARPVAVRSAIA